MQLTVYRDTRGFDALDGDWNSLLSRSNSDTIFGRHEWQRAWWKFFSADRELLLLSLRQEGELLGIAPFYRQQLPDGQRVIQLIGGTGPGNKDVCDYLDIIALPKLEGPIYEAVFEFLTTELTDWDEIDLHCIPDTSPYEILRETAAKQGLIAHRQVEDLCPIIPLPPTWDDYLSMLDRKQRHELRRKMRRAKRKATIDWYIASDPDLLFRDVEDFFELHRQSNPAKETFISDPLMQEFFHEAARFSLAQGWLNLSFLLVNGEKAASMLCFEYNNRTLVYNSGYDPHRFSHLSTGIVLLGYHIQDSIAKGHAEFDFLRGDEEYKHRFGAQNLEVYQITIQRK